MKYKIFRKNKEGKSLNIFYIESTLLGEKGLFHFLNKFRICIKKVDFKMMDVRNKTGELVRVHTSRQGLFDFQEKVIKSEAFKSLYHKSWQEGRVEDYIKKGLITGDILEKESASRTLYLIQIVFWHMSQSNEKEASLFVRHQSWFDIYKENALDYGINLYSYKIFSINYFFKTGLISFIKSYPYLYFLVRNFSYRKSAACKNMLPKLFLEGRGDVNVENNGYHSDFFWLLNSKFPKKNVLYQYHSEEENGTLETFGINVTKGCGEFENKNLVRYAKPKVIRNSQYKKEYHQIKSIIDSYDCTRRYWRSFFYTNNVKIHMLWHRFDNRHMAIADAMDDVGGISIYWPASFDGYKNFDSTSSTNIVFNYSSFSAEIEKQNRSKHDYGIIAGYLRDYAGAKLKKEAQEVRKKMQANGAEKIVFVIDENSTDDSRWHTGHELQRENYSYILEKVISTPWLGVIFKPKVAKTLRKRLGAVNDLLVKGEATGRCYIYEESGRHVTSASPVLAALSADLCIHGHLNAGTAALECVLEGLPTLLVDREVCKESKLYELPEGKVIFKNWPDTIEAVMEHFSTPNGTPGFGDWSSIVDNLDPFRDGLAANRMGTYLHWLLQGYEEGLDKEVVMKSAAEKYIKTWGADKVITQ